MLAKGLAVLLVAACGLAAVSDAASAVSLPAGFHDEAVLSELPEPTALRFAPEGRVFVAEKTGRVVVFDSIDDNTPTVFADLRTQVYDPADRGLLGLALDPHFPERPYVYLLYTYDHVLGEAVAAPEWGQPDHSGDVCPKPKTETDVDECPVSGRLVRLTAGEGGEGDHAVENGEGEVEEKVLVEDWCQQFSSHSIGDLQFDSSGALYASGGDGASFNDPDYGQFGWPQKNQCGDPPGPVGTELTPPGAEGGALRAQDARTPADPSGLDGSVIRIDPETGEGLPGNPMFASADANARRIVGYGFRNPFRFAIDPARNEIYVANVGWNTYEEIDRMPTVPASAYNSGWPCYEGPGPNPVYQGLELSLCEGLYAEPGAAGQPFFHYKHGDRVVPEDDCDPSLGSAISGLAFYRDGTYPAAYDGALFFADPVRGCVYVMFPDDDGRPDPLTATTFISHGGLYPGVDLEVGPEGNLFYVKLFGDTEEGTIHRVSYDPDAPVADLAATPEYAAGSLEAMLDAGGSSDPKGQPLSFKWDLDGNGSFETSTGSTPEIEQTFGGDENVEVAVQVSDGEKSSVARKTLYPGDTPPEPEIEEPLSSLSWGVGQEIDFSGSAQDAEEEDGKLPSSGLYWKTRLYHCPSGCHAHPLRVYLAVDHGSLVAPDHDYPSHIEISLTATDERGLHATRSVDIFPRTVDLTIASDPSGVELGAGLLSQAAPFALRAIEGANVVLSAPAATAIAGTEHDWLRWSDGGPRTHTIVAAQSATYTAFYSGQPIVGPSSPGSPPQTHIVKRPARRTLDSWAHFVFGSSLPGSSFSCSLDRGLFKPCRSSRVYKHLKPGRHVLKVFAVDAVGVADTTPVVFGWTVLAKHPARR